MGLRCACPPPWEGGSKQGSKAGRPQEDMGQQGEVEDTGASGVLWCFIFTYPANS